MFEWSFFGDKTYDLQNILKYYENVKEENRIDREGTLERKEPCKPSELLRELKSPDDEDQPLTAKPKMYTYKEARKLAQTNQLLHGFKTKEESLWDDLQKYYTSKDPQTTLDPLAQANSMNYRFQMPDVQLNHIYSITQCRGNNIIWDEDRRRIFYTSGSTLIVEELNSEKTQTFLHESSDPIHSLEISLNKKFLLAYS